MSNRPQRACLRRWTAVACVLPVAALVAFSALSFAPAATPLAGAALTAHCAIPTVTESSVTNVDIGSSVPGAGGQVGRTATFPAGATINFNAHTTGGTSPTGPDDDNGMVSITVSPSGYHWSGPESQSTNDRIPGPTLGKGTYTVSVTGTGWTDTSVGKCPPPCKKGGNCPNTPQPYIHYLSSTATYKVVMT